MKRYDSYKDSGVEWIGEIPSHWEKSQKLYLKIIDNKGKKKLLNLRLLTLINNQWCYILISNKFITQRHNMKFQENDLKRRDDLFSTVFNIGRIMIHK